MKTSIIQIGNSKGVRIPKKLLEEANLIKDAEIFIEQGAIVIRPSISKEVDEGIALSYSALAKEWDSPEEDAAWASLQ